jgi:hypothetical protein
MTQRNLLKQLKYRYKLLTDLIAMCCLFPPMFGMILWIPIVEPLEASHSKAIAGVLYLFIFLVQVTINFLLVANIYRLMLWKFLGVTKEQFWMLAFCKWYPTHWLKSNAT